MVYSRRNSAEEDDAVVDRVGDEYETGATRPMGRATARDGRPRRAAIDALLHGVHERASFVPAACEEEDFDTVESHRDELRAVVPVRGDVRIGF